LTGFISVHKAFTYWADARLQRDTKFWDEGRISFQSDTEYERSQRMVPALREVVVSLQQQNRIFYVEGDIRSKHDPTEDDPCFPHEMHLQIFCP
jgi:hypothetical protein